MNLMNRMVFLGVLFGAVSCDINCFIEKQITRVAEFSRDTEICRFSRDYLTGSQEDAKTCSMENISVEGAMEFTKDICTVGWDLNNKWLKHETCFQSNLANAAECEGDFKRPEKSKELEYIKHMCSKLDGVYKCFIEKVGKPCGDEGMQLMTSFMEAFASYTKGICKEVNST